MKEDLEVVCYKGDHTYYVFLVALPMLIFWTIGIPTISILNLREIKRNFFSLENKEKYGFLCNGYRETMYFWEILIMFRKVMIIFAAVFLAQLGTIISSMVIFIFLLICIVLNLRF